MKFESSHSHYKASLLQEITHTANHSQAGEGVGGVDIRKKCIAPPTITCIGKGVCGRVGRVREKQIYSDLKVTKNSKD